jgi:hypothetical protein
MTRRLTTLLLLGTLPALAGSASGQGRSSVNISTIGRGTQIGDTAASRTFREYSTGVGSLGRSSAGGGTSVLRSSLSGGSLSVRRGSRGAQRETLGSGVDRPTLNRGTDYGSRTRSVIQGRRATGVTSLSEMAKTDPLYGTRAFLSAVRDEDTLRTERVEPITSLVPDQPGKYRDYLAKGERYFKAAKYIDAVGWFEMASVFDGDDPESLLSLTHAKTATQAYPSAAFLLRKAVRNFPELPLLPLRPRGFYGDSLDYADQMAKLRKYVSDNTYDPDGHLLLAYYQWFEGEPAKAKDSLATAYRKAQDRNKKSREHIAEAIDIFWKGMVATGKVSGELIPGNENKDTTTQPAADEEGQEKETGETSAETGEKQE